MLERQRRRLGGERCRDARRHDREVEDAVGVVVLGDRVRDGPAVGGAGDDHADLDVERHPLLDDARARRAGRARRRARRRRPTATWPLPS